MNCPQCKKTHSREMTFVFNHSGKKVHLVARSCQVCGNLFAEDKALLRAARKHLKLLTNGTISTK